MRHRLRPHDVVVGISASGVTPFVDEGLRVATTLGASTILLTTHPQSPMHATVRICVPVGPELLTGSTRLKAGTATKLVLNMLTLGAMAKLGKTSSNLMVEVRPTSRKLRARALGIIQTIAHCDQRTAARCLTAAEGHVKIATLMAAQHLSASTAIRQLARAHGRLNRALADTTMCRV